MSEETPQLNHAPAADPVAEARTLRQRGYAIVWLHGGEQNPDTPGWNLQSQEPEDCLPGDNLAIQTGALSGDLVCVALESPKALELADQFLPPTPMVDGLPSKPRSHRWYAVTDIHIDFLSPAAGNMGGPRTARFRDAETEQLVLNLLGTGDQAAVPPSVHESGERRIWYGDDGQPCDTPGEPAVVPFRFLFDAVYHLALACDWHQTKLPKVEPMALPEGHVITIYPPSRVEPEGPWNWLEDWERVARCRSYLATDPPAVIGAGKREAADRVARLIVNDFAVPEKEAEELLREYSAACEPPLSDEELRQKLEEALAAPPDPDRPQGCMLPTPRPLAVLPGRDFECVDDPDRLARAFNCDRAWRWWQGEFWQYDGARYRRVAEETVKGLLWRSVKAIFDSHYKQRREETEALTARLMKLPKEERGSYPKPPQARRVTISLIANVTAALRSQVMLPEDVEQPCWLSGRRKGHHVAFRNGILAIDTGELTPHSSDWFSPVCLPYPYDPAATCPRWLEALDYALEGDQERLDLMQQWFGYNLVPETRAQAFMLLTGEGGNGKSVFVAALEAMLGEENCSHVSLEDFGQRFGLFPTVGKLANIYGDLSEMDRTAEGRLKGFVCGERMTMDRKNLSPVSVKPTSRLTYATNVLPRFVDRTQGIWRRLLLVPFQRVIPAEKRVRGMDQTEWWVESGELPGIFNWALAGLNRLRTNGWNFPSSAVCAEAVEEHRLTCNPAREFLVENYCYREEAAASTTKVYLLYQEFCRQNGYKQMGRTTFIKEAERTFPGVFKEKTRPSDAPRDSVQCFVNLAPRYDSKGTEAANAHAQTIAEILRQEKEKGQRPPGEQRP